jgi:hypothetical protein
MASRSGMSSATIRASPAFEQFGGVDELGVAQTGRETEDGSVGDRDPCEPHAADRTHVRVLANVKEIREIAPAMWPDGRHPCPIHAPNVGE